MSQIQRIDAQGGSDLQKTVELVFKNYKLFLISLIIAITLAYVFNHFSIPVYKISSSMLIKEESRQQGSNINEYLNSSLFGTSQNLQNELWVLKSSPVLEQTIKNLDLNVDYYYKKGFQYLDAYENVPFKILVAPNHVQPIDIRFHVFLLDEGNFQIEVETQEATFYDFSANEIAYQKDNWSFQHYGKSGKLIETPDLSFILEWDHNKKFNKNNNSSFYFDFKDIYSLINTMKNKFQFRLIDKQATIIESSLKSHSLFKGIDIINELMNVYTRQNLDRKNHIASITIDYIEKQLDEISNSLSQAEDNLQTFRSSHQLLNVTEQVTGITAQYMDLQNQMAELVSRKRYYDYVAEYLAKNDDFSNMIVPASMGIQDQLLNNLLSELISAQAQRSNLIENKQEKNPLVQRLSIQIENFKKTISENISAVQKTTDISIEEMNKRIRKVETQISRLPITQRQLGGIERTYRLNDAIYNYMLEKRAEAKITQASNLPDNIIIEPAKMVGTGPVFPNKQMNYLIALLLGLIFPFGYLLFRNVINNKIESQEDLEKLTELPVLGKILHNHRKTDNIMQEYPTSTIAESYRALRTNLDYYFKKIPKKVILVTSCIEKEGKSFSALNIAMSYAQLDRMTILLDFDLRKTSSYFGQQSESLTGLSSYLSDRAYLEDIILHSTHDKLNYITSGPIPPNPVELLALGKTKVLIDQLKDSYDCIVIDTSPLAQVSDAYLLLEYADVKVIIARYNYSIKKVVSQTVRDLKQKSINNLCIVLNDNRIKSDQYGYGYGYDKRRRRFKLFN